MRSQGAAGISVWEAFLEGTRRPQGAIRDSLESALEWAREQIVREIAERCEVTGGVFLFQTADSEPCPSEAVRDRCWPYTIVVSPCDLMVHTEGGEDEVVFCGQWREYLHNSHLPFCLIRKRR